MSSPISSPISPVLLLSSYPIFLLTLRLFSFLILLVYIYLTIEYDQYNILKFLSFYTNWGMLTTSIYYSSVLLTYRYSVLNKLSTILLQTAWTMQGIISLMFWAVLFKLTNVSTPMYLFVPRHGLFPFLLLFDIIFSNVRFNRIGVKWTIVVSLVYFLGMNLPYTLFIGPVYPFLTYSNSFSVIFGIGFGGLMGIWNEVGCWISNLGKRKMKDKLK